MPNRSPFASKPTTQCLLFGTPPHAGLHVTVSETLARRAEEIESRGITSFDALHLAAAEAAGCDYLVTTDDGLLKKFKRHSSQLKVSVLNSIDIVSLP